MRTLIVLVGFGAILITGCKIQAERKRKDSDSSNAACNTGAAIGVHRVVYGANGRDVKVKVTGFKNTGFGQLAKELCHDSVRELKNRCDEQDDVFAGGYDHGSGANTFVGEIQGLKYMTGREPTKEEMDEYRHRGMINF